MVILFVYTTQDHIELAANSSNECQVGAVCELKYDNDPVSSIYDVIEEIKAERVVFGYENGLVCNGTISVNDLRSDTKKILSENQRVCEVKTWDIIRDTQITVGLSPITIGYRGNDARSSREAVFLHRCYLSLKHRGKIS